MTLKPLQGRKPSQSQGFGSLAMVGAGLGAAVLFTLLQQGTWPAIALAQLTPLPIMISTLGFGPALGFGSVAIAAVTVAVLAVIREGALSSETLIASMIMGIIFTVVQALPAWWLAFVSSLAKQDESTRWRVPSADKKQAQFVFYPVGHILVHAAVIAFCLVSLIGAIVVFGYGGFEATIDHLMAKLQPLVQKLVDAQPELASFNVQNLTQLVIKVVPAFMASWTLVMFLANLWLAGRVAQTSNRLRRPWPDIAQQLALPRPLAVALAAALGLCFVKSWLGTLALIAAATLVVVYALQGLAVVHYLSRGSRWRGLILSCIYAVLILFIPWPLALFALLGLADMGFSLRERKGAALLASKP